MTVKLDLIPDCITKQLRDEAVAVGDEKTVQDCDLVLHEDPFCDESMKAVARLRRILSDAAAQE